MRKYPHFPGCIIIYTENIDCSWSGEISQWLLENVYGGRKLGHQAFFVSLFMVAILDNDNLKKVWNKEKYFKNQLIQKEAKGLSVPF